MKTPKEIIQFFDSSEDPITYKLPNGLELTSCRGYVFHIDIKYRGVYIGHIPVEKENGIEKLMDITKLQIELDDADGTLVLLIAEVTQWLQS